MEQKFIQFDDAVEKLGISPEKLNELRESGELRAYRDGASWKFRSDEIDRMLEHGIPDIPEPSDIGLIDSDELVAAEPLPDLDMSDDDGLELADLEIDTEVGKSAPEPDESAMDLELEDTDALSAGSELEMAGVEDTVTTGGSDVALDLDDETASSDPSDSILLSEEELGESVSGSLSTIIGRQELEGADLELDDDDDEVDTKLASAGASDVLSMKSHGSGVLDEEEDLSDAKKAFKDLEELEIDLAAESSLALSGIDDSKGSKVIEEPKASDSGSLQLELEDEPEDEAAMGSTDVPLEELSGNKTDLEGDVDLAGDSDLILAEAGGSDITLDSGDSGINLISPSDSGLALDDIPLDVEGSAILSSLSLEGSDPEISLLGGESGRSHGSPSGLQTDDDFQLTPLSEGGDEGDSSSQVIALDADLGEFEEGAAPLLEENAFDGPSGGVVLDEGFGEGDAVGMGVYGGEVAMVPMAVETEYTLGNVLWLVSVALLLAFGGLIVVDMIRNMWTWNDNFSVTTGLLDALLSLFGLT